MKKLLAAIILLLVAPTNAANYRTVLINTDTSAWSDTPPVPSFGDGTVSAPSINFASDTGNGIYKTGTGSLGIASGANLKWNVNSDGQVTQPLQSCFMSISTGATNFTGNGTAGTILFNTEIADRNAEYNPATGIFTAKTTGLYLIFVQVEVTNLNVAMNYCDMNLITSNRNYFRNELLAGFVGNRAFTFSGVVDMDASDTAYVTIEIGGSAFKQVNIVGNGHTRFSGTLIN